MKPVRVCLVGAGFVADAHIKGYLSHPGAEVAAVCDSRREYAKLRAEEFGARRVFGSLDEVLADDDVNAVDIMTPPDLHVPMAIQAANAGRHVMCEKPFCLSVAEGRAMAEAARAAGVVAAVGESYLFTLPHMKARELIEDGAIGRPMMVRQRFGGWAPRERPGRSGPRRGEPKEPWRDDPIRLLQVPDECTAFSGAWD